MKKTKDANLGMHILEVEITTRCNLNCKHCYNRNKKVIDLSFKKFKDLYRFAEKYKVWTFTISGGEALLHPEFDRIVDFVSKTPHRFRLILQTNGSLIDDATIKKIRIFDLIHLSCDWVDDVRRGGWANFALAQKLRKSGLRPYLFVTLHRGNLNLIDKILDRAKRVMVPVGFNICVPTENLDKKVLMSKDEFMQTEKKLCQLFKEGKILRYSSPFSVLWQKKKVGGKKIRGGCSAGVASCVVNPVGDVYPCPFFRVSAGNIFKVPLKKLWLTSSLFSEMRQRECFEQPCGSCEYLFYCGGCRKRAFYKFGNLKAPDPMCYKDELDK